MWIEPYHLPPDKLAKALNIDVVLNFKDYVEPVCRVAILALALRMRWFVWLRNRAESVTARRWLQGLLFLPVFAVFMTLISLPFDMWLHQVRARDGISLQEWPAWFAEQGKSLLLGILVGTPVLLAAFAIIRRAPKLWWLWFWLLWAPFETFTTFIRPYVLDPIFDQFEPMAKSNPALVGELEKLIAKSGTEIPPSRIFLLKSGARSTVLNAYVTGVGASKRIVVYDITAANLSKDQLLFLVGHELGHYVLDHMAQLVAYSLLVTLLMLYLAKVTAAWIVGRFGRLLRISSLDDWAAAGVLALVFTVLVFLSSPAQTAFERSTEHQADVFGIEVIHGLVGNPQQAAAEAFQLMGESNLEPPYENPLIIFWSYTHPSPSQRINFAAAYDPWQPGMHPRYFPEPAR
ncbi:MAG: M48 family metalloprotease [Bryobacteraceae bacterium]